MKIKLTRHVTVDAKGGLIQWSEWDVVAFQVMTSRGKLACVRPDECVVLDREATDTDVEIARLKFVVAAYEELIRKWADDVQRLRKEIES